jgi:hypothetical protein
MKRITYILLLIALGMLAVSCAVGNGSAVDPGDNNDGESKKETEPITPPSDRLDPIDFSDAEDGSSPEDYGFIVGSDDEGLPGFMIMGGVIESGGTAGGWLALDSPDFEIHRMKNGGVVVHWEVRYVENLPARSRERSKFYVALTDIYDASLYEFEYKPFLNDGDNREASLIVDGVKTSANQTDVTPSGPSAPWLSFKMELLDTGEITVFYDYDGSGWIEMLGMVDTTYELFQGVRFTYRTTAEPKNYTIQLRNLSVLPIAE